MSLPTLRETRASMTTASPKPPIIRAVDDESNYLPRKWFDAVSVGNDTPRILLARGPATGSAFATRPTRFVCFQGLAMPFPSRVKMLPLMGKRPEPNLGIGEIAVRLAKLAHGHARERVLAVDREKLPQRVVGSERLASRLLMFHAVEYPFGVACTRQGGPRPDNGHNVADGISALNVGIGCARADVVGTVEKDGLFRPVCMCV